MPDGYSRWREDFAVKEPSMIETGFFVRPCPSCRQELELKLSPEKDDIEIKAPKVEKKAKTPQIEPQSAAEAIKTNQLDRKCAYCFRTAIRGGVLCREHSFCFGDNHGPTDVVFQDGKPYELKDRPLCKLCAA